MTPTQARYLAFIQKYIDLHGIAPSEKEISDAMCVMPPSVNQMIKSLEKLGFISRSPGVARSIRIILPTELVPKWKRGGEIVISEATKKLPKRSLQPAMPLCTFEARLYDGPFGDEYRKRLCIRYVEIRTDQTLSDLHSILFEAFGMRVDAEYEFNIGGKSRFAKESKCFGLPEFQAKRKEFLGRSESYAGNAETTQICDLGLKQGQVFGYCFDFEHDWYYFLWFTKIENATETVEYPRVTRRQGKAPPQKSSGGDSSRN
ncbi:MAG: MarR family transcriptional regulator [Planctomycetales bacterium]|nr:MarR family transcriptional regulator [Planctomycetales bacterium]